MVLSSKRTIAKNTVLLYARTLIVLFVSLWTSRIILQSLGVEDFGIYNAVGGLVSMFSVLTGSMSTAISRFITFEIGTGNLDNLKHVFNSSVIVQLIFIAVIALLAETVGLWFLNNKMTIPDERLFAANWVFQFTIITFAFSLLAVPYNAEVIAHEHMNVYALVSIVDNLCRLLIAYLIFISPIDNLIFYSLLMAVLSILIRLFYQVYCKAKFLECRKIEWEINKNCIKKLGSFAGWNMFGQAAVVCVHQGNGVLLNVFFGPIVNAAYGIANQVNSAVMSFSNSFTTAFSPSITKSYAVGNYEYLTDLVVKGAQLSFYLLYVLALPLLLETKAVLNLWLNVVPDYAEVLVRLILVLSLIEILSQTLIKAAFATGNIKRYQIVVGSISLLTLPIAYVFLKLDFPPSVVIVVSCCIAVFAFFARLFIVGPMIKISFDVFMRNVVFKILIVSVISACVPLLLYLYMDKSLITSVIVIVTSIISTALTVILVGLSKDDRINLINKIKTRL